MPISFTLLIAALTALRLLCLVIAGLFLILAIKGQYDETLMLGWGASTGLALAFFIGAAICNLGRKALVAKRDL